jgi:hypothetical protein
MPRCLTSPRRADYYKVALHFLDRRGCPSLKEGEFCFSCCRVVYILTQQC